MVNQETFEEFSEEKIDTARYSETNGESTDRSARFGNKTSSQNQSPEGGSKKKISQGLRILQQSLASKQNAPTATEEIRTVEVTETQKNDFVTNSKMKSNAKSEASRQEKSNLIIEELISPQVIASDTHTSSIHSDTGNSSRAFNKATGVSNQEKFNSSSGLSSSNLKEEISKTFTENTRGTDRSSNVNQSQFKSSNEESAYISNAADLRISNAANLKVFNTSGPRISNTVASRLSNAYLQQEEMPDEEIVNEQEEIIEEIIEDISQVKQGQLNNSNLKAGTDSKINKSSVTKIESSTVNKGNLIENNAFARSSTTGANSNFNRIGEKSFIVKDVLFGQTQNTGQRGNNEKFSSMDFVNDEPSRYRTGSVNQKKSTTRNELNTSMINQTSGNEKTTNVGAYRNTVDHKSANNLANFLSPRVGPPKKPPINPNFRTSSTFHSPKRNANLKREDVDDIESDESVQENGDDAESGMKMNTIRALCRINTLFVRAKTQREMEFWKSFKFLTVGSIINRKRLANRVSKLISMNFIHRFTDYLKLYPRRAFLKWKVLSDDMFMARQIPKIALTSRINYQIAIIRMKHMVNINKTKKNIKLRKAQKVVTQLIEMHEVLTRKKNDSHANKLHAFSRIKDKYHRSVLIEIIANTVESVFEKRKITRRFIDILKKRSVIVHRVFNKLVQAQTTKENVAFERLGLQAANIAQEEEFNAVSRLDLYSTIQYLKKAASQNLENISSRPKAPTKLLEKLHSFINKKEKTLKSEVLTKLKGGQTPVQLDAASRIEQIFRRIKERNERVVFRAIKDKKRILHKRKVDRVIRKLIESQQDKMRQSIQELHQSTKESKSRFINREITRKAAVTKFMTDISRFERQRKMTFFTKLQYLISELKMHTYMDELHRWSRVYKDIKTRDSLYIERVTYEFHTNVIKYVTNGKKSNLLNNRLKSAFDMIENIGLRR